MKATLRFIGRNFEFLLGGIALIGVAVLFWWHQAPKMKHKCCANISVVCDCEPRLCRCGGTKTCTESCYQEAKRQGRVK
jgi:hypothetical protein